MKKYFFHDGTAQQGPFDLEELKAKNITANTQVWFDPMPAWKPAGTVDELKSLFTPTTAPAGEDWNIKQFYYMDGGMQQGPFFLYQLKEKNITSTTRVWYNPLPEWTTAAEVPALKEIITSIVSATPAASAPSATIEDWSNKQFYYSDGAGQHGPFKPDQLKGKGIAANTPVWYDPLPKWTTAGEVHALKDIIGTASAATNPAAHTAPKAEDWANKQYFFMEGGRQQGPFNLEQLKGKNIISGTPVWYDPLPKWTTAGEVAALKDILSMAVSSAAPASEDWNSKQFYYSDSAGQHGPFKPDQLKGKGISANTAVWYDPLPKWTTAGEVPALKDILSTATTAPAVAPAAPKAASPAIKQYFFIDNSGQQGPFSLEQLKGKSITANTQVWFDPMPEWKAAGAIDELKSIISSTGSVQQTVPPAVVIPKQDDWSNKEFFYIDAHGQQGPFKLDQLKGKNITANTMVWYEPLPNWTTAGEVPALKNIINNTAG